MRQTSIALMALILAIGLVLCTAATAQELTFSGKNGAEEWAKYLNSFLPRKVNDDKAEYWTVEARAELIAMQRMESAAQKNRVMMVSAMDGEHSLGGDGTGDGEITFVLAAGCPTGFRCRITVPQVSITGLGAGYIGAKQPSEKAVFYIARQGEPVLSADLVRVKAEDKGKIASSVALRITRTGGTVTFSYDAENDGTFTTLHTMDIGAGSKAFFGIDDLENVDSRETYLIQKISLKGVK